MLCSIHVHVCEDRKGGNMTMMISPTLSCGSSFVKTIWKQLNSLFVNHLTGNMDFLAHRLEYIIQSPCIVSVIKSMTDQVACFRAKPCGPHTLSLRMRPTWHGQLVFEVKSVKLMMEEHTLFVHDIYIFAIFYCCCTLPTCGIGRRRSDHERF
jgi:hypothetical protein